MPETTPTRTTDSTATLTDFSYDDVAIPEVDSRRVEKPIGGQDSALSCEVGDVLWIKGNEYVVAGKQNSLLNPSPLLVVGEDGTQDRLAAGVTADGVGGVAFVSTLETKDSADIRESTLLATYDYTYKLESNGLEKLHEWVPNTDSRGCPHCDRDRPGTPLRVEQQQDTLIEIRKCLNTDCGSVYRYTSEFPNPTRATILEYESHGEDLNPTTIKGIFRVERQDDFKIVTETNTPRTESILTAQEVAGQINPKMVGDDKFGVVSITDDTFYGEDRLKIEWKNDTGYQADLSLTYKRIGPDEPNYWMGVREMSSLALERLVED